MRFDGTVALNDLLAFGVVHELARHGLTVPRDVDDTEAADYSLPSLSSVNPGRDEIAKLSVKLLHERIQEATLAGEALPPRFFMTPSEVMPRDTTRTQE